MKILHIENQRAATRQLLTEWLALSDRNVTLYAASTLGEAVQRLGQERMDGVVVDLDLPDCKGLATSARLCTAFPELPVVALSKDDAEEDAVQAIRLGAQDYICSVDLTGETLARRLAIAVERKKLSIQESLLAPVACSSASCDGATLRTSSDLPPSIGDRPDSAPCMELPGTNARPVRVLYVQQDVDEMREIREATRRLPASRFLVQTCNRLSEALVNNAAETFDVMLLEWKGGSHDRSQEIVACRQSGGVPGTLLAIADPEDDWSATQIIQFGVHDVLSPQMCTRALVRSIRMALEREWYAKSNQPTSFSPQESSCPANLELDQSHVDLRRDSRYILTRPVYAVPVLPGFMPDVNRLQEGVSVDLSASGMGFNVSRHEIRQYRRFVVGIEASQGMPQYAMAEARYIAENDGHLRVGVEFADQGQDPFREEQLLPALDPNSYRFQTGLSSEALYQWQHLGVLQPFMVDRVYVCPNCGALPTLRRGCRGCGSGRLVNSQLIHHFVCAYVGFVAEFEGDHEMTCPKCRTRKLVVGSDFEYLPGPARCVDCGWSGTDAEQVAHCCRCNQRFPLHRAAEVELTGYHVNRLDPLALIGSS